MSEDLNLRDQKPDSDGPQATALQQETHKCIRIQEVDGKLIEIEETAAAQ